MLLKIDIIVPHQSEADVHWLAGPPVFVVQRLWCSVVQNANLGQTQLFRSAPIFNVYNVPAVYLHHKNVPAPQKMHYKIGLS